MANILTAEEAARVVVADPADQSLLDVLPQVDAAIEEATGRDWTQDAPIDPIAKRAARCRLAVDYDLGSMAPQQTAVMERAYASAITQLEAKAVGMQALKNVNTVIYADDMLTYLSSGALGLNLVAFNRLLWGCQKQVAKAVLDARPIDGYADVGTVQAALDAAVKAVMP